MAKMINFANMQEAIGEKYRNNQLIVLENSVGEIKILLAKDNVYCIDELRKVLTMEKRINAMLVEKEEIRRLFTKIYDLFEMNYGH